MKRLTKAIIPIDRLVKDPMNPRRDPGDLSKLIMDISEHGFMGVVVVRPLPDGTYGVVRGSRRVEAARITGWKELECYVVEGLSDPDALLLALKDEDTWKPLTEEEYYLAVKELAERFGSLRKTSDRLGRPFESIRSLVERMEARKILEDAGVKVVDKRSERDSAGVRKTTARKVGQALKRLSRGLGRKVGGEPKESQPHEDGKDVDPLLEDPFKAVEMLEWRPKLFKAVKEGPYLHELLKRPEVQLRIPKDPTTHLELASPKESIIPSYYPTVRLNPPYTDIYILLCPKCNNVLRGIERGAPIVCLECAFPSDSVWKPEGG